MAAKLRSRTTTALGTAEGTTIAADDDAESEAAALLSEERASQGCASSSGIVARL